MDWEEIIFQGILGAWNHRHSNFHSMSSQTGGQLSLISHFWFEALIRYRKVKRDFRGGPRVPPGRHGTKLFTSLPGIVSRSAFLVWVHGPISLQRFGITNCFRHVGPYCERIQWMPQIIARQIDIHCNHYDHGKMILEQPTNITTFGDEMVHEFFEFFWPPPPDMLFFLKEDILAQGGQYQR